MTKNEELSKNLAELCALDCNSISKYPIFYLFSLQESGSASIETKFTPSGEALKKKLTETILSHLQSIENE